MDRYLEIGAEASAEEEALPRMSRGMVFVISALGNYTHLEIECLSRRTNAFSSFDSGDFDES